MKKALLNTKQFLITLSCISFFMVGTSQSFAQDPPEIRASDTCVLIGESIDFSFIDTSSEIGNISYLWSFGDGTTASGTQVSHTYRRPGLYTSTLVVFDFMGNAYSKEIQIEVKAPCGMYQIELPLCEDVSLQVGSVLDEPTLQVGLNKEAYLKFDTREIVGDITKIELELSYEGFTNEIGTIQLYEGSSSSCNESITPWNVPQKGRLLDEQSGNYQLGNLIRWTWNDAAKKEYTLILSTNSDKTFTFGSGEYYFEDGKPRLIVYVTNDDPNCNDDCSESPPSSVFVSDDCLDLPGTVTFRSSLSSTSPIISHLWHFGDGTTATGTTATHTYYSAGIYTATYIAVDLSGQSYAEEIQITVNAPCGIYEASSPASESVTTQGNLIRNEETGQIGDGKEFFLKFDTRDIIGRINKLELELSYEGINPASGNIKVYKGTHSDWTAENITAENMPRKKVLLTQKSGTYQLGDLLRFELDKKHKEEFKQEEEFTLIITTDGEELVFGSNNYYFEDGKPRLVTSVNNAACIRFPCPGETNEPGIYFEAECAVVGSNWTRRNHINASNGQYLLFPGAQQEFPTPPTSPSRLVKFQFFTTKAATYDLYSRILVNNNVNNSFWVRINNGSWIKFSNIPRKPYFQWVQVYDNNDGGAMIRHHFSVGFHTIDFAVMEDGIKLDKIGLLPVGAAEPAGEGPNASNCAGRNLQIDSEKSLSTSNKENNFSSYPNPFTTSINLDLNFEAAQVDVRVFDALGRLVEERANVYGKERLQLGTTWTKGIYFVHIQADEENFQQKLYKLE